MSDLEPRVEASKPAERPSKDLAVEPTARFTDRVKNYVKARPGYPADITSLLVQQCGLTLTSTLVDVGCGTGLLTKLFCEFGCNVIGVEPNAGMREAGQQLLSQYPNFEMIEGQAESIPLPSTSVDFITVGQAFHWFELDQTRHEFMRVLKPNGWAMLVWNDREFTGSKFAEEYEGLLVQFGIDYAKVHQRGKATAASFERFFGSSAFMRKTYPNLQKLNYEGFVGRLLSSSYMPNFDHPNYQAMMREVDRIFHENDDNGILSMKYTTSVTYGTMT